MVEIKWERWFEMEPAQSFFPKQIEDRLRQGGSGNAAIVIFLPSSHTINTSRRFLVWKSSGQAHPSVSKQGIATTSLTKLQPDCSAAE